MPKQKTNKSVKKRIKVTAKGKIKFAKGGKRHLNSGKPGKQKRQLRSAGVIEGRVAAKYVRLLAPGL